jgi:hypothetical protein
MDVDGAGAGDSDDDDSSSDDSRKGDEDSDFSYESSPDERSSPEPEQYEPLDPELDAVLPKIVYLRPAVPDDLRWHCPIEPCRFRVNLMRLTDDERQHVAHEMVEQERDRSWSVKQDYYLDALMLIVEVHYREHLEDLDIHINEKVCILIDAYS